MCVVFRRNYANRSNSAEWILSRRLPVLLSTKIPVAARTSPLSRKQVEEVLAELRLHHPNVDFDVHYIFTTGDLDQKTSLRTMGKSDFFTREIDQQLLQGRARIAIHSAKDLPEPLPEGLAVIAVTRGLTPADALVLREGESLQSLQKGARIATSSERREEAVRKMRSDLTFIDLRGTIAQRIEKLHTGEADGAVIAEAALIRLGLTHLNRVIIPGETVPGQGKLAIVARLDDPLIAELFQCLNR
ncbi:MAG: hydroxymethylbilane synthase [Chlamydiia bacterium]|nr:hydroxymethylbilane synthase [Chlamydiia bacterium]